jgi:TatD DNase family protein
MLYASSFKIHGLKAIDSHCHPQFPQYDSDRESVIERSLDSGVGMICVGTDIRKSKEAIAIAERFENLWATIGLHPNDIEKDSRFKIQDLREYKKLLKHPKVVAVGEVGLDYYRTPEPEKQKKQKEVLKQFIDLAIEYNKPLIIHCRDAHDDMLEILESHRSQINGQLSGVAHSFTGTHDEAKRYLDLGLCIGLNGIITFTDQYDDMVKNISLENILIETDAPFLAPVPYRGKRNEPVYVIEVAKKIAQLKKLELDKVLSETVKNTKRIFGL